MSRSGHYARAGELRGAEAPEIIQKVPWSSWESSDSTKLEIDAAGRARFLQRGLVRITCRAGSVSATAAVLIRPNLRPRQSDAEWRLDQQRLRPNGDIVGENGRENDSQRTRHYLGIGTYMGGGYSTGGPYETTDSSHIVYNGNAQNGGDLTYPDGTRVCITMVNNRLLPTTIVNRNGNYIQIAYSSSRSQFQS
ncbi:MAG: hypothetical protein WAV20_04795 [Blastocatellia bacterium]